MRGVFLFLFPFLLTAETRTMTLREAVDQALRQNPDLLLARLDEQKANLAVKIAQDPFRPKIFVGSGAAYSNGFPMSIEGSAPSIVQAKAIASIFNRALTYRIAQTNEDARTVAIDTQVRRDDIILNTAVMYFDSVRWSKTAEAIRGQVGGLERSETVVRARVQEGRELEIEAKRAALAVLKTKHRLGLIEREQDYAEATLASLLGMPAGDRLRPVATDPMALTPPDTPEAAVRVALLESREVRKLESAILAKRHELKQLQANRLPTLDLVAQYGLFAKYNNYEDFFRKFQRHNGQIGVSIQVPIFPSSASVAQGNQTETEIQSLRTKQNQTRNRISLQVDNSFKQLHLAEQGREIARVELELAREQVNILLAQSEEGRATLRQLEESRFQEQEKWIGYYDAQFIVDKAKLELLKLTGGLLSALQ